MEMTKLVEKSAGDSAARRVQIAAYVLIAIGVVDLIRGFMHTFNIRYAAANIAQVDLGAAMAGDFLVVMSAFGISNYVTGMLAILIAFKAKKLAPLVLAIIPTAYVLGIIGMQMAEVERSAAFNGRYMIFVYLALCALTALYVYVPDWLGRDA